MTFLFCANEASAAREPRLRILVFESRQARLRADGDRPLLVRGIGRAKKRVSSIKVRMQNGQLQLALNGEYSDWKNISKTSEIRIRSNDPKGIWLGKRRYRGELRVRLDRGIVKVINHIGIENYLQSVVGSEMPKTWPLAALKAQAVASRTYALSQLKKQRIYDMKSNQNNQVYLGIESEARRTITAVKMTRSLVMVYKGKLIEALFHSSSGGQTESSGNVWRKQLPYLVSVIDYDQDNPSYKWEYSYEEAKIRKIFSDIGGINSIEILNRSNSGRVIKAKIYGPKDVIIISGKDLRRLLSLKSTLVDFSVFNYGSEPKWKLADLSDNQDPLYQSDLNSLTSKNNAKNIGSQPISRPGPPPPLIRLGRPRKLPVVPAKYTLLARGRGSGHGVGMSQWGAYGLAQRGKDFRMILKHYFKGVKVVPFSFD